VINRCIIQFEKLHESNGPVSEFYEKSGQLTKAVEWTEKELKESEKKGNKYLELNALNRIGNLHNSLGNLDKALSYFEKVNNIAKA